jgi:hypothetical protein
MREAGRAHFHSSDVRLVASVAGALAEGLRRASLLTALTVDDDGGRERDPGVGLILLADDDSVETTNAAAEAWIAGLRGRTRRDGICRS